MAPAAEAVSSAVVVRTLSGTEAWHRGVELIDRYVAELPWRQRGRARSKLLYQLHQGVLQAADPDNPDHIAKVEAFERAKYAAGYHRSSNG